MSSTKYNALQSRFALNWLSNSLSSVSNFQDKLQPELKESILQVLNDKDAQALIGEWDLVWGPVVFSAKDEQEKSHADNSMALVKSATHNEYVLTIAGTNPISPYGWFVEDFNTGVAQNWPFYDNPDLKISAGTYIGLQHLLAMKDGDKGTVVDFLTQEAASASAQTVLTVAGHSLGGALSASLALGLQNIQTKGCSFTPVEKNGGPSGEPEIQLPAWDPAQNMIVGALSSAGATPGNKAWARFFDEQIGSRALRIWNRIDVVPHAWQEDMLIQAPHLYYPFVKPNAGVLLLTDYALWNAKKSGLEYTQIMEQIPGLYSSVNIELTGESLIDMLGKDAFIALVKKILSCFPDMIEQVVKVPEIIRDIQNFGVDILTQLIYQALINNQDEVDAIFSKHPDLKAIVDEVLELFKGIFLYLVQMAYQHVYAYVDLMGVNAFVAILNKYKPQSYQPPST